MGSSGNVTGAHSHIGLRFANSNGNAMNMDNGYKGFVDPLSYILDTSSDSNMSGELDACLKAHKEAVDSAVAWEKKYNDLKTKYDKDIKERDEKIRRLEKDLDATKNKAKADLEKTEADYEQDLADAKKDWQLDLEKTVEDYKKQLQDCKDGTVQEPNQLRLNKEKGYTGES